ncbi:MAG: acyltransferase [Lachnospiraceae bacterium]|nr:acyltransferase [Lachnospiraceae bacterium]
MKRNHFIDVLKGICIIFVIITHYNWSNEARMDYLFPFWIDMAVPIFMILSGYVYANSFERKGISSIGQAYQLKFVLDKIIRYTVPFLIAYVLEIIICAVRSEAMSAEEIFVVFWQGGLGPGSWYFPVMLQFIFTFPVVYFIIKKYDAYGLLICAIINVIYGFLPKPYEMSYDCYRLLLFRYLLVIAFGCYLHLKKGQVKKVWGVLSCLCGIAFLVALCYMGYMPKLIRFWPKTSYAACLYIMPLAAVMLNKCKKGWLPFEVIGKASFNILLAQMVYYRFFAKYIYAQIDNKLLELLAGIAISLVAGVIFYYIETPITKFVIKKADQCMEKERKVGLVEWWNRHFYAGKPEVVEKQKKA